MFDFIPWGRSPRWAPFVCMAFGVLTITIGVVQFAELRSGMVVTLNIAERFFFWIGGSGGLLAAYVTGGTLVAAAGVLMWIKRRTVATSRDTATRSDNDVRLDRSSADSAD